MKRVHLLIGAVAASGLAGCVGGPARNPNPLGNNDPNRDLATSEQYPLRSSEVKEEVDRQFEMQHPGTVNWLFVWGKDRWFDFLDVWKWDVSAGRGFGVNAHLTEFAQAGVNWWDGQSWGMRGRAWGQWETSEEDRGLGPFYWVETERKPLWGTQNLWSHEYKYTGWDLQEESGDKATQDWSEIGGKFRLFAVGASAGASPVEAVDFLAGLFPVGLVANLAGYHHPLFDLMDDDTHAQIEKDLRTQKGLGD